MMPRPTQQRNSMQFGSYGPGAQVYQATALRPPQQSEVVEEEVSLTLEQTKNVCFKCFLLGGRPAQQCYLKDSDDKLTPGHTGSRAGSEIGCKLFDEKYPISHASERDLQLKNAQRVRRTAYQKARRAKPPSNELN